MKKIHNKKGFTLIELILSLTIIIILMIGYLKWEQFKSNAKVAENGGIQMQEFGRALSTYVSANQQILAKGGLTKPGAVQVNAIPTGCVYNVSAAGTFSTATNLLSTYNQAAPASQRMQITNVGSIGGSACPATIFVPTSDLLAPLGTASATNIIENPLGFQYDIQLMNTQGRITALLISRTQVLQNKGSPFNATTNPINMSAAGLAVKFIGPQGGVVEQNVNGSPLALSGLNNSWTLLPTASNQQTPFFPIINAEGQIGYRVSPVDSGLYDDQYLRIDGTNYMTGNLNAGNWDIQNATNISYNGWLTGYGILANTINSGQINNSGDIFTGNDVVVGRYARMKDAYISSNQNVAPARNTTAPSQINDIYLSEIIPQYVSKGATVVGGFCGASLGARGQCRLLPDVPAPTCPPGATAKVVVTPLVQGILGKTYGEIDTQCENCGSVRDTQAVSIRLSNLQTYSGYGYQVSMSGSNFQVYANTLYFQSPAQVNSGGVRDAKITLGLYDLALVQRYCDLGNKY